MEQGGKMKLGSQNNEIELEVLIFEGELMKPIFCIVKTV